jgi:hypothetical protein
MASFAAAFGLRDRLDTYPFLVITLLLLAAAILIYIVALTGDETARTPARTFSFVLLALAVFSGAVATIYGPQRVTIHLSASPQITGASIVAGGKEMDWKTGGTYTLQVPANFDLDLTAIENARFVEGFLFAHNADQKNFGPVPPQAPQ